MNITVSLSLSTDNERKKEHALSSTTAVINSIITIILILILFYSGINKKDINIVFGGFGP